ncbi:MAG: DegT/DnrJ/EryC1/StrS family aminotransferase [Opitutaceae bacterium]|nr:DegT/DnrJ/EryC1/StrS family aminotransferase [Cytophagales bacterium]
MNKTASLTTSLQPLSLPDFSGIEAEQLISVLRKCELGEGEDILQNFEKDFKKLANVNYCVPVSSATSGLHLALLALEVGENDEVICPTFTFAASAFPILYQKATPVFVDSEKDTWNISPEYLEKAIKSRILAGKKPRAIIIVHSYGNPAKIASLLEIANHYQIPIIEDAANALGSTYNNLQVGTFGTIGVFSFNRNKIISGGAGGSVITNNKVISEKVRYFAHQAKSNLAYYHHENIGYNYGLSPILAEIIRLQLPTLEKRILLRRYQFDNYLKGYHSEATFQNEANNSFSNRWLTVFKYNSKPFPPEYHHVWKPLHTQPVFEKSLYFGNQESVEFFNLGVALPFLRNNIGQ